ADCLHRPQGLRSSSVAGNLSRYALQARTAFQLGAVPAGRLGGCLVRALQEREQGGIRGRRGPPPVVREQKFTERLVEGGTGRPHRKALERGRGRIGVRVESRMVDPIAAWPETGAAYLVRVGLLHDSGLQSRSPTGKHGGPPAREARGREV